MRVSKRINGDIEIVLYLGTIHVLNQNKALQLAAMIQDAVYNTQQFCARCGSELSTDINVGIICEDCQTDIANNPSDEEHL